MLFKPWFIFNILQEKLFDTWLNFAVDLLRSLSRYRIDDKTFGVIVLSFKHGKIFFSEIEKYLLHTVKMHTLTSFLKKQINCDLQSENLKYYTLKYIRTRLMWSLWTRSKSNTINQMIPLTGEIYLVIFDQWNHSLWLQ